ncbi:hypothetical protein C343_03961 [Cryptococcus neoformans C23]|nr:hypothetical protein C343_03961 [Cryptococcus neoformans var. grubii C23]OXG42314.1 hypothetical protein C359_02329 [Cryptococcus neoformans var. grubii Bt120]
MPATRRTKGLDPFQPADTLDPRTAHTMQDIAALRKSNLTLKTARQYATKNKQWYAYCTYMNFLTKDTVTPANAASYLYNWVLKLPPDHHRKKQAHVLVREAQGGQVPEAVPGQEQGQTSTFIEGDEEVDDSLLNGIDEPADPDTVQDEHLMLLNGINDLPDFKELRESLGYHGADASLEHLLQCKQSLASVRLYLAALVDLWETQRQAGMNAFPSPRTKATNSILNALRRVRNEQSILRCDDKGDDLFYDGIATTENMKKLFLHYLHRDSVEGLRDLAAQAVGIHGLLRADDQLRITLSSMSLRLFENEGPTPCRGVVFAIREGKTTHDGQIQYSTLLRNKDVTQCPVSFLVLYLFARFHFSEESFINSDVPFPSLKNRQDRYHIPLFVSRQPDTITRLKYDALNKSVRKALRSCGIHCRASTHTSRKWGAQLTEDGGAPEEDIMRQGRWCTKDSQKKKGSYYLPRDMEVPQELIENVFPWVDAAEAELFDPDRSQDAPFIRQLEPDLFVWKHPVFSTSTFLAFEARVLAEAQSAEARMSEDARQLIPELSDYLSTNFTALFKATYNIDTTLTGLAASVANNSKLIQEERRAEKYDALLNGIGDAFHAMARRQHSGSISSRSNVNAQESQTTGVLEGQHHAGPNPSSSSNSIASQPNSASGSGDLVQLEALVYKMDRDVGDVLELWDEYIVGRNGRLPVREMSQRNEFRKNEAEKKMFSRGKPIYEAIRELARGMNISEREAAGLIEEYRTKNSMGLNKLSNVVKDVVKNMIVH